MASKVCHHQFLVSLRAVLCLVSAGAFSLLVAMCENIWDDQQIKFSLDANINLDWHHIFEIAKLIVGEIKVGEMIEMISKRVKNENWHIGQSKDCRKRRICGSN
jgi:hypothetical protein